MKLFATVGVFALMANGLSAYPGENRFLKKIPLDLESAVVVAEGEFEPRSIGSYSVRLYGPSANGNPTDVFAAGLIRPREGFVEKVFTHDVDRDGNAEIIVVCRCAGTGGFLSIDAISFRDRNLSLVGSLSDLPPKTDPRQALSNMVKPRQ